LFEGVNDPLNGLRITIQPRSQDARVHSDLAAANPWQMTNYIQRHISVELLSSNPHALSIGRLVPVITENDHSVVAAATRVSRRVGVPACASTQDRQSARAGCSCCREPSALNDRIADVPRQEPTAMPRSISRTQGPSELAAALYPDDLRHRIVQAGNEHRLLRLTYHGITRLVEPYSFAVRQRKDGIAQEYLFAWDCTGGRSGPGIKTFVHYNIRELEVTDAGFKPRFDVELTEVDTSGPHDRSEGPSVCGGISGVVRRERRNPRTAEPIRRTSYVVRTIEQREMKR